jgi:hypothetical protein
MMNKIIEENRVDEGDDDIVVQQKENPTKKLQWFNIFLLGKLVQFVHYLSLMFS